MLNVRHFAAMNCCIIRKYALFVSERSYGSTFFSVLVSTDLTVHRAPGLFFLKNGIYTILF